MKFERKSRLPGVPDVRAILEDEVPERDRPSVVDPPKPKARESATARAKAIRARSKPPKPPVRVTPGWIHKAAAAKILESLQTRITKETGSDFNVGELPTTDELAREGSIVDDRSPLELLSRILAHIGHRTPGIRNIEKKLEGKDSSSGILSDITAFFAKLYTLNEDTMKAVQHSIMEQAMAKKNAPTNGGVSHDVPV